MASSHAHKDGLLRQVVLIGERNLTRIARVDVGELRDGGKPPPSAV